MSVTAPKILSDRKNFRPFQYPLAFEMHEKQNKHHWMPTEVSFEADVHQYRTEFSEAERHAVRTILKLFTQIEQVVSDYWTEVVSKWFKQPEIVVMSRTFSSFEGIHAWAYDKLNTELGLDSEEFYLSFLNDEDLKKKFEYVEQALKVERLEDLPKSLAIFSAFTEGVSLYSSFAILINFQRFNKLKNVANIIAWSCRDESLHSSSGCWLFRTLVEEMGYSKEQMLGLEEEVKQAAGVIFELEKTYLDQIFGTEQIEGVTKEEMTRFIQIRINQKLKELGFSSLFKIEGQDTVSPWFNKLVSGEEFVDFFEARSTNYTKGWNFEGVSW